MVKEKRGKPQDQKIRELLSAYYTMQQGKNEYVPNFAHRFSETQHQLEKYIPNVHKTSDGSEIELIRAFVLKVRPDISKELVFQNFSVFKTLQAVVEAAQRYEVHTQSTVTHDVSSWKVPAADCQISHVKQAHRPNSAVTSNLMNSGTKLKPQGQYVSKQASSQNLRLSSCTVTNRPNQANGNVNSYVSPPQPAQICLNYNRNVRARYSLGTYVNFSACINALFASSMVVN